VVNSLLTAIVRADGDALVMHVGEKPYVVAPSGPVELSSRPLTFEAVTGMLGQLLPGDTRRALDELGAIEHDLPRSPVASAERFTVVAARGGTDIWIEIRRHRQPLPAGAPAPVPLPGAVAAPDAAALPEAAAPRETQASSPAVAGPEPTSGVDMSTELAQPAVGFEPVFEARLESGPGHPSPASVLPSPDAGQAVILPLTRDPIRPETGTPSTPPFQTVGLERVLRLAIARGADTVYLMSGLRPSIRVDGGISGLDGEAVLAAQEVESFLLDLAPERTREALQKAPGAEWMSDVPDVGRFRCQSFRDHRGPGGIFRLVTSRPPSAEHLGLSREIQSLCAEPEGLILVAGPRASGKSTIISAFVDLINRTRSEYVITIESQVMCAHDSRGSLISQREVSGASQEVAAVVRAALRENPDVLVIEDLRSPEVVALALDAMEAGRLVIGAVPSHTATSAIGRILDQTPADRRQRVQLMLAQGLRGVVSQVLVPKAGGGRVAAREVLLNTSAIAGLIAEGRVGQLPAAIDSGRKAGMVPLNDALAGFVQSGVVDVKDAYRKAFDRQAFLAVLRREGIDTSFVEQRV
jgi:twitching motility protein PilT